MQCATQLDNGHKEKCHFSALTLKMLSFELTPSSDLFHHFLFDVSCLKQRLLSCTIPIHSQIVKWEGNQSNSKQM